MDRRKLISAILVSLSVPLAFIGCMAGHDEGSDSFSSFVLRSAKCDPILFEGFKDMHAAISQPALCATCHVLGGQGNGAFADPNISVALPAFMGKGVDLIYTFATNPNHKSGFTGPQNTEILSAPKDKVTAALADHAKCLQDEGISATPGSGLPLPSKRTQSLSIPTDTTTPQVIRFDLGTMANGQDNVAGTSFEITIQSFTTDQSTGYDISLPRLIAGGTTVYVKNLGVVLNNQPVPNPGGSTFQNVDRYVAANTTRTLYQSGAMRVQFDTAAANTIAVAFERIELAPDVNFTPASFANLTAAANQGNTIRVFALRCAGCHSGANPSGGLTISPTSYTSIFLKGLFTPYDLNSRIWKRVENNEMPPAGPLPDNEKEFIRGWIMDGAPR